MTKTDFLTKEQELALGTKIQNRAKALVELAHDDLTDERRAELRKIVQTGDRAVQTLVKANLGLVYDQARRFKKRFSGAPELEDIIQEGMLGLMTAVHKYDPARNNKFSTVAFYWIAQAISRGTNKTGRLVRLPENRIADYTKIVKLQSEFEGQDFTQTEIDTAISEKLGLSIEEITTIKNAAAFPSSLNRKVGSDADGSRELLDVVAESSHSEATAALAEGNIVSDELAACVSRLSLLQQKVLASQFSLPMPDGGYLTPTELRERDGLSSSVYRRALNDALEIMREQFTAGNLSASDFLSLG